MIGTAGSGKSLLTATLTEWYKNNGINCISVNLDPGVSELPYVADVDIRDRISLTDIMDTYKLGPNGALILACDLIATNLESIIPDIEEHSPEYVIIDTPGQIEQFVYRNSGPYVVNNIKFDERASIFLFDGAILSSPSNFLSISLLSSSLQLRLGITQIPVLTKCDLIESKWKEIISWSSNASILEEALNKEKTSSMEYLLSKGILQNLTKSGSAKEIIPYSAITQQGLVVLEAIFSRIFGRDE